VGVRAQARRLRCVAVRNGNDVELWSRNHLPFTPRFPQIVSALRALPADNFTLDGELVAYDEHGNTSFGLLQRGGTAALALVRRAAPIGSDTRACLCWSQEVLAQAVEANDVLTIIEHVTGDGDALVVGCVS